MVKIDMWYKGEKPVRYTANFYPKNGKYMGNLFNADDKPIGDFVADDSVEMEKRLDEICRTNMIVEIPAHILYEFGAVEAVRKGLYIAWTDEHIKELKERFGYKDIYEYMKEHANHGRLYVVINAKEGRVNELMR